MWHKKLKDCNPGSTKWKKSLRNSSGQKLKLGRDLMQETITSSRTQGKSDNAKYNF